MYEFVPPTFEQVKEYSKTLKPKMGLSPEKFYKGCVDHKGATQGGMIENGKQFYCYGNYRICRDYPRPKSVKEVADYAKTFDVCYVDPKTFFYGNDKRGGQDLQGGRKHGTDLFNEGNNTALKRGINYKKIQKEAKEVSKPKKPSYKQLEIVL